MTGVKKMLILSVVLMTLPLSTRGGPKAQRFSIISTYPEQLVVEDIITVLGWQGCPAGLTGGDCDSDINNIQSLCWQDALAYCQDLSWGGHTDWRLPNVMELRSIVDNRTAGPALDETFFPATPADYFWTSTTSVAEGGAKAWRVDFNMGAVDDFEKSQGHFIRCVR